MKRVLGLLVLAASLGFVCATPDGFAYTTGATGQTWCVGSGTNAPNALGGSFFYKRRVCWVQNGSNWDQKELVNGTLPVLYVGGKGSPATFGTTTIPGGPGGFGAVQPSSDWAESHCPASELVETFLEGSGYNPDTSPDQDERAAVRTQYPGSIRVLLFATSPSAGWDEQGDCCVRNTNTVRQTQTGNPARRRRCLSSQGGISPFGTCTVNGAVVPCPDNTSLP